MNYSDRATYWRYTPNRLQIIIYRIKVLIKKRIHLLRRKGLFGYFPPQKEIDEFFGKVDLCNNCNWAMTTYGKMCKKHEEGYQKLIRKR